jgi:tRNA (mo5U34)-methyltransferase
MALGLKWSRVAHLDLKGKRILDVGCGNGYYMWRMLGAGADSVIGVDPNWLFFCQFQAVQRYLQQEAAWHLPFPFEDLPPNLEGFDTVFSMGVFYHRRSPIEHLLALKDCLVKGGELVLETLVIEGDATRCWCRKTATRRCATCGSCRRCRRWNAGCAVPVSATCAAWT